MGVNHINTADGKELINLMNDTVSEDTLLSGETAHNAAGDLITGKVAYVNPNLLINRDFSINQRGKAEYSGAGYTVDGWFISANGTYNATTKVLAANATATTEVYIEQKLENPSDFRGKAVTLSAILSSSVPAALKIYAYNGSEYTVTKSDEIYEGIVACTLTIPDDTTSLFVRVISYGVGETKVEQVKLELGSIQTLARQDDEGNWVIIDPPPNPAVELLKCQRFFERVQIPVNNRLTAYMFTDTSSCSYNIEYKPKRTVPTIVKPEYNGRFVEQYNQRVVVLTSFDIESLTTTNVSIHAAFAAALDSKSVGWVDSLGYVDVSAEL